MQPTPITHHAIDRWQQRVDRGASRREARLAIAQFLSLGRARTVPRHWMTEDRPRPGRLFVYWSRRPGVCIVVVDGVAVTTVTRELCQSTRHRRLRCVEQPRPRPQRARLRAAERWHWDGSVEFEDAA